MRAVFPAAAAAAASRKPSCSTAMKGSESDNDWEEAGVCRALGFWARDFVFGKP